MKDKMIELFDKMTPAINKLTNNNIIRGISGGMMATLPITVLGSFSLLLVVVPLGPFTTFVTESGLAGILSNAYAFTMGLLAIYVVFFVTKSLVTAYMPEDDGMAAAVAGLASFLILTPIGALADGVAALPTTWLGAQGTFTALFVSIFAAKVYVFFKKNGYTIKMPASVPPMVSNVFTSITPFVSIGVVSIFVSYLFSISDWGSVHQAIYSILQGPLQELGGNIVAVCFLSFLMQLLWFFGIHGQNVLSAFYNPIWMALDLQNMAAFASGDTPPNIVGAAFYGVFCFGGYQLGLIFWMLKSKSKRYREVGKLALGPSIFGIGEPLNFGFPLVLNFRFIFPFLTNGVFMLALAYFVIDIGLVPHLNGSTVVFGLPVFFSAFIQGGWKVVLLMVATQVIPILLWYPWFKMAEKDAVKEEQAVIEEAS